MPAPQHESLAAEIREAHCGFLPERAVPGMVRVQRARDASMARALADTTATGARPVVLIAGRGHVRADRGVPAGLDRLGVDGRRLVLGLVEVDPARTAPADAAAEAGAARPPYDLVWFTGHDMRDDPCERLRQHMTKGGGKGG